MNKIALLFVVICIVSCTSKSGVKGFQSKGNLETPKPAACVSISQLDSGQNPADIFTGMSECLSSDKYSLAAEMYFAAMTYGIYDTKRVSDKTSHQGLLVLRMNVLGVLSEQKLALLQSEIDAILEDNEGVCRALVSRGVPTYHPRYMIQHGIGAFTGGQTNKGLVERFDSEQAWSEAIKKTVKCE